MENEDKLSFLDGDKGATPAPDTASPPAATPASPASTEQPRNEQGQFAPKASDPTPAPAAAAQPAPAPTPAPAVTPAPTPEPKVENNIPLATALDWKQRMTAAERRLKELETTPPQPRQVPSASEDPEGYAAYLESIAESTRVNTRFEMSEALAREKHGDDATQGAMDWAMEEARKSPAFAAEYMQQRHPIDWAVKQQKRHAIINEIGESDEAYVRRRAAELGLTVPAPTSEPQPATPATAPPIAAPQPAPAAPKSIAHVPAAGGGAHSIPTGPGSAFAAAFQKEA
jgi:hypothetical protein